MRTRVGLGMVMAGLAAQLGGILFWSPGAFILSAALGVPLVATGALLTWLDLRRAHRAEAR
jgi:hypothetical protein